MSKRTIIEKGIALAKLGFGAHDVLTLMRYSSALTMLDTRYCNGEGWGPCEFANGRYFPRWTDDDMAKYDRKIESIMGKAQAICNEAGGMITKHDDPRIGDLPLEQHRPHLIAYHQTDPRGASLYIVPEQELRGREIMSAYTNGVCV